jgi:hypothetical protein
MLKEGKGAGQRSDKARVSEVIHLTRRSVVAHLAATINRAGPRSPFQSRTIMLERQISDYLRDKSGPLRVERLSARVLGVEWQSLSADDRGRVIREVRRCGFTQHSWPMWTRADPPVALTEAAFAELVEYANRFADANGRVPTGLRELASFLKQADADADTIKGLFGLADDTVTEMALRCATFIRAA